MAGKLFSKLFLDEYFFTIALRKRNENLKSFVPEYVKFSEVGNWAADPMLAEENGQTYLFYEAVKGKKGQIEVASVNDNCSLSDERVILNDKYHYSYPFVFKWNNQWYMIPECSEAEEVRLYRAIQFPYEWEMIKVILRGRYVDTTVFEYNGRDILLTYVPDKNTERVFPEAYELYMDGELSLKKLNWVNYDELRVRGAGPVFNYRDKLIRPAQVSEEQRYGNNVIFYEIESITDEYVEKELMLFGGEIPLKGYYSDGMHTYCSSGNFEAIDIRCRKLDTFKVFKRLIGRLAKKSQH